MEKYKEIVTKRKYLILGLFIIGLIENSCVEPFEIETQTFEDILVVEGTITNENKKQEVLLSRSFRFEENSLPENQATVKVIDNLGAEYMFEEIEAGKYLSENSFAAQSNHTYQLNITTALGKIYNSNFISLTHPANIDEVYAEREVNENGIDGIKIFVDGFNPTANSLFYRYEFEETFKIIAPLWNHLEAYVVSTNPPFVDARPRTQEEQTCYKTEKSTSSSLYTTIDLAEDRVDRFQVHFIPNDNYIISHRYSILVKQFIQSREAFTFYKTLKDLSTSESLFSENQPGFLAGNIVSLNNPSEKVAGFFDVSSVSTRRLFFNYIDFYDGEPLPPYVVGCTTISPPLNDGSGNSPLINVVESGFYEYFTDNPAMPIPPDEGELILVPRICGDCTVLGSNVVPDFWIE